MNSFAPKKSAHINTQNSAASHSWTLPQRIGADDATELVRRLVRTGLVATVPPTVRLTSDAFGRENSGVIYGWVVASHQLGAALAAFGAGSIRTSFGDYRGAFWISGAIRFLTAFAFLFAKKALGTRLPGMEGAALISPLPAD